MSRRDGDANAIVDKIAGSGLVKLAVGLIFIVSAYFIATGVPATLADATQVKADVAELKQQAESDRERLTEIEVSLANVGAQLDVMSIEIHDLSRIRPELQRAVARGIKAGVREALEQVRGP